MSKFVTNFIVSILLFFAVLCPLSAQDKAATTADKPKADHSYKPLTLKLNDDGSKYVRFITWHQFWLTHTANNPGTLDVEGKEVKNSTDFALRRSRFLIMAQISPRFLILTHWGINNQSFINGGSSAGSNVSSSGISNAGKRPQLYIHDAWTEFAVVPDKLYLGTGLHYWNGISRLASQSTLNFMTLDAPIVNWATIEATDQFARQFGIYAKGQLGRFDYRIAANKPFANGLAPSAVTSPNAVQVLNENWAALGYFDWMFWDKETNKLPFFVGSHLGAKKVFNLGAGFYYHPNSTGSRTIEGTDTIFNKHNTLLLGIDAFLDMPINKDKGTCLNVYSGFYNYDYGPGYLRNIGILNLHTATNPTTASLAGGGNAQPTLGTGIISYTQVGYALPKFKNGNQIMPYVTTTFKKFERLNDPSVQFDLGLNYFVTGHNAKVTLQYATRPIYTPTGDLDGSKGEFILQTHIFL